jgi:uncharacterized protein YgbK (DUF1537 family)
MSDGGPAFPFDDNVVNYGMSLRDYFAAAALQLSGAFAIASLLDGNKSTSEALEKADLAQRAYAIADAMIEARKK